MNTLPDRPMDWPDDFHLENGNYQCRCLQCQVVFIGHKGRTSCKVCHDEYIASFVPFTFDFDYEKEFYDVLLPSGEIVHNCWPNGGVMNAVNNDTRKWSAIDGVKVRRAINDPLSEDPVVADVDNVENKAKSKVIIIDDTPMTRPPPRMKKNLMAAAMLATIAHTLEPDYHLPVGMKRPDFKPKTKCQLPSCDRITSHNGGYCSPEHCNLHRHQLRLQRQSSQSKSL